jgi:hypothetical protein
MKDKAPSQQEVIDLVKEKGYSLDFDLDIPSEFKGNIEVLTAVLEHGNSMTMIPLEKISEDIFKNRDFLKLLVDKRASYFGEFPEWVRDDEEMARLAVCTSSSALEGVSVRLRSQRDFVMWAFSHERIEGWPDYVSLDIVADESLKNDLAVLKLAVKSHPQNYGRIPQAWRTNEEIIQSLLTTKLMCHSCFDCLPPQYRDDREIAVKALNDDGGCFQHLSERLRDDRELAMVAIGDRGMYLQHASPRLRDDKEVVLLARNEAGSTWDFVSERLKKDLEVVATYVSENAYIMEKLSPELRDSQQVVEACLQSCSGSAYKLLSEDNRGSKDITLKMSAWGGFSLEDAPEEFRKDREIVANAVKSSKENFKHISSVLLKDDEFLKKLVLLNGDILLEMDPILKERLFTTTLESVVHHERKVVYKMVIESPGIINNQQRPVAKGFVAFEGHTQIEILNFPAITYEEDGPVGSYLSWRFVNNLTLVGGFTFFVKANSGRETSSLHMRVTEGYKWNGPRQPNEDFLKHEVYLLPNVLGSLKYEDLTNCSRIYWGRMENLPRGIQLFPSEESYREAFSVLTQKEVYGTPDFIRIDDSTIRAAETDVDEVFGAARVYVDDHGWRFLIPHAGGALKSLEELKATTDADDWTWIKSRPSAELDARRKELLKSHFGAAVFANEVSTYVGG